MKIAKRPRTRAARSTRAPRALPTIPPSVFARFDSTGGAVAIGLLVLGLVAGALAIAPRTSIPPPPIAARDIHPDEPLSPLANPGRVPDAKSAIQDIAESRVRDRYTPAGASGEDELRATSAWRRLARTLMSLVPARLVSFVARLGR